ncbi:MAG: DNA mismatch repair protein MutS [Firmicutes bacterium]|nr:DNA mismatch repair protein MutS [Bacillota bacterium]
MESVYPSVLFSSSEEVEVSPTADPAAALDLHLDRIAAAVTNGREAYDLAPYFATAPTSPDGVAYRQEVFRDLEREGVLAGVRAFVQAMRSVHQGLEQAAKMHYRRQRERWFLDSVRDYCRTVQELALALAEADLRSRGLRAVRDHLDAYLRSGSFRALREEADAIRSALEEVRYCVWIRDSTVTVRAFEGEEDYSRQVEGTFERFRTSSGKSYVVALRDWLEMNHIEAEILDLVARLYPDEFERLSRFHDTHADFIDPVIARFEREIQFYLGYLDMIDPLRRAGLPFCYPELTDRWSGTFVRSSFDLALAIQLTAQGGGIPVTNDWRLDGAEHIVVVTGPNSGGKTTFARALGQAHHLARLGCPIPGEQARLRLVDTVFTHFERREDALSAVGKLEDDLIRIRDILVRASERSLIVANEMLASTTLRDAAALGRRILERIRALGALCVWVTFIDELAAADGNVVSMVAAVQDDDPTVRTYRIVRRPPMGRAYALSVARRHGLTYESVRRRIGA